MKVQFFLENQNKTPIPPAEDQYNPDLGKHLAYMVDTVQRAINRNEQRCLLENFITAAFNHIETQVIYTNWQAAVSRNLIPASIHDPEQAINLIKEILQDVYKDRFYLDVVMLDNDLDILMDTGISDSSRPPRFRM